MELTLERAKPTGTIAAETASAAASQLAPGISVVVCTYNGASRLPATLEHLRNQSGTAGIVWEVIVVDNASTDGSAEIAKAQWPVDAPAPLRILHEPRPGKTFALEKGFEAARCECILIVDDDNWLAPDWIQRLAELLARYPEAAAIGGKSAGAYQIDPPAWFERHKYQFAISPEDWQGGDWTDRSPLWGAGFAFRKSAWMQLRADGVPFLLAGRKKGSLAAGEDTEFCYQLRLAGWRLRYEPSLQLQHYMPAGRLNWDYVRRLYQGTGETLAAHVLYQELFEMDKGPVASFRYSWWWQVLGTLRLMLTPRIFWKGVSGKEGADEALVMAQCLGALRGFWNARATYQADRKRLKQVWRCRKQGAENA